MSVLAAYSRATGKTDRAEEKNPSVSPAEEALLLEQKTTWLQHPNTEKMMKELGAVCQQNINEALNGAMNFPTTANHQQIIQKLVKAQTIREVLETYGR